MIFFNIVNINLIKFYIYCFIYNIMLKYLKISIERLFDFENGIKCKIL
jgi:hypothetical protein